MKLAVSNISRMYAGRAILKDCSYTFDQTGTYVLRGQNGSGKSTFLRICALLERPDSGQLVFEDGDGPVDPDLELKRRITLVLPRVGVFSTSVFRNAAYGLAVRGRDRAEIEDKVMTTLQFVGLDRKRDQHARTLSSGETQRLGIARALVLDPEILFLDEPTASIDEENTGIVEDIITNMRNQGRTLVIMTTHDNSQARRLADRVLVLRNGTIADARSANGIE